MRSEEMWRQCAEFHGHECPGLAIGFKAVEGAWAELGLPKGTTAVDEEIVCITENDACGVDAVQYLLSCTIGKANLIMRLRGKMAFSFFIRGTDKRIRLCLKPGVGEGLSRIKMQHFLLDSPYTDLFDISVPPYDLPEGARKFPSHLCSVCGEKTAEYALRLQDGKPVCLDCYNAYQREGF